MDQDRSEKHILSLMVENQPGVLSRIAGLFSGRGFNIESLSVNETLDSTMSQMTIVTRGDDRIIEQIDKQLNKLVDVIKVIDFHSKESNYTDRELILIKVNVDDKKRSEILSIIDIFRAKVVDVSHNCYTVEITGDEKKISAAINLFRPLGIKEIVRSGKAAMSRRVNDL